MKLELQSMRPDISNLPKLRILLSLKSTNDVAILKSTKSVELFIILTWPLSILKCLLPPTKNSWFCDVVSVIYWKPTPAGALILPSFVPSISNCKLLTLTKSNPPDAWLAVHVNTSPELPDPTLSSGIIHLPTSKS